MNDTKNSVRERPKCPLCETKETVVEEPEAGHWLCTECGERGSGVEYPVWWRDDEDSIWYIDTDSVRTANHEG